MSRTFWTRMALLAALAVVGGCGPGTGTVTGKVTYKSKPVATGTVTAIPSDGVARPGVIGTDGSFTIPAVPNGDVKFLVASPNPDTGTREAMAGRGRGKGVAGDLGGAAGGPEPGPSLPKGSWVPLPESYADAAKTDLKGTVKGDTAINLELK